MGIENIADLLSHYPRRYVDRTKMRSLHSLVPGERSTVVLRVLSVTSRRSRANRAMVEARCSDGSAEVTLVFFNQGWRARQLSEGAQLLAFGKLEVFRGRRQMVNPTVDLFSSLEGDADAAGFAKVVPIYPSSDKAGIVSWQIARWVDEALRRAGRMADPLPAHWRSALGLWARSEALQAIHAPRSMDEVEPARRRLAFDELLRIQVAAAQRRSSLELQARGVVHLPAESRLDLLEQFWSSFPFEPTRSQAAAMSEIARDMATERPMHRLLQGDVGSGKTLVAADAMLRCVAAGYQAVLLAPTEVLAVQHHLSISQMLGHLEVPEESRLGGRRPLSVGLLTARLTAKRREALVAGIANASVDITVGTHALLSQGVEFAALGLVVVDEQHRFGVEQRSLLREKASAAGTVPDMLVMTATPIPRTAALTFFGDLDLTTLDELPPGRSPVQTVWAKDPQAAAQAWNRVREEVALGHRAYVVCPLVEGSERMEARSAKAEMERLASAELEGISLGLLHGQMPEQKKADVMEAFRTGEVGVLVATTVVEVGVDVGEATVMVVEDADRFGIAQLHQLRGRVGRSSLHSWCFLLSENPSPVAAERLAALEATSDGFELAKMDLEMRGEGTLLGVRQKGRSELRLASLSEDADLVVRAHDVAAELVSADPSLSGNAPLLEETEYFLGQDAVMLSKS